MRYDECMKKTFIIFFAIIAAIAVGEGLYITYPSWSPLLSWFTGPQKTATSTSEEASALVPAQHIDEHGQYYDITSVYPGETTLKKTAGASADARAVALLKGFIEDQIAQFKKDGNFANLTPQDVTMQGLDQGRKYLLNIDYKTYAGAKTVSYVFTLEQDTLGAHPNAFYRTFTFDSKTGANLELSDLFTGDYLGALSKLSRAKLPPIIAARESVSVSELDPSMMNSGTTPDAANFQAFYIDGAKFVIVFPPYQVGPYVLGPLSLPIPFSELSANLKTKYK